VVSVGGGPGIPNAQLKMGIIYDNGTGLPRNYVEANMWYSLAEASGASPNGCGTKSLWITREAAKAAGRWQPYAGMMYFHILLESLRQAGELK
jgi:TPR repeat protein